MKITRTFDLIDQLQKEHPNLKDILAGKIDNQWKKYSVSEYSEIVNNLSLGLLSLGVKKDDKIATIILNSPEWNFFDMALMQIGAIQVPVYPTISEANFSFIFKDAEIKYAIVYDDEIYAKVKNVIADTKTIKDVYSIHKSSHTKHWC